MYKSTLYPYVSTVKLNPDDTNSYVKGEVYYIPDEALPKLDKIEAGYHRGIVDIITKKSGIIKAYMYITANPSGELLSEGEFTRKMAKYESIMDTSFYSYEDQSIFNINNNYMFYTLKNKGE